MSWDKRSGPPVPNLGDRAGVGLQATSARGFDSLIPHYKFEKEGRAIGRCE